MCDKRYTCNKDNPNRIDKVLRKSIDNGECWSNEHVIIKEEGEQQLHSSAAIDNALLYDEKTETLFLIYCLTPAGIGLFNSKKGTGMVGTYLKVINNDQEYYIKDHYLFSINDEKTAYFVDNKFNVFKNDKAYGNLKTNETGFKMYETSYLMLITSKDDGETWSEPLFLNSMVKKDSWAFIGP